VHEGALPELETAIKELAEFIAEHEPRLISYNAYFSEDGTEMTVVHVHPDAASLDRHMEVVEPRLGRFADLLTLSSIDVYGEPSPGALGRLQDKLQLLGSGKVTVHRSHTGFIR
jgi:hypothetical protein